MRRHMLYSLFFVSLPWALGGAEKPDLSGAWKLVQAKSDLRESKVSGLSWTIAQSR